MESISNKETCRIVAEWDTVVYQAMLTVFLPDILGPCDMSVLLELKTFSKDLPNVLFNAFNRMLFVVYRNSDLK